MDPKHTHPRPTVRSLKRRHGGTVIRRQTSIIAERGWTKKSKGKLGHEYRGFFHANGERFPGKATVGRSSLEIYIRDLPPELFQHSHADCFMPRSRGWYWVHHTQPGSLDSGILEIEAILNEALTGTGGAGQGDVAEEGEGVTTVRRTDGGVEISYTEVDISEPLQKLFNRISELWDSD